MSSAAASPGTGSLLWRAITGHGRPLLGAVLLFAGWQAAEAVVPVLVGVIIDEAVSTGDVGALLRWLAVLAVLAVLFVVLFVVLTLGYRFGARLAARAGECAGLDLRLVVADPDPGPPRWCRDRAAAG